MTTTTYKLLTLALLGILAMPVSNAQQQTISFINTVSNQLIIAGLEVALNDTINLQKQSHEFCKKPDEPNLNLLQQYWKAAMHSWSAMDLFRFGPMIENNIDLKIHYLPIRKKQIKANIITPPEDSTLLPVSSRGLASLEYLIFDPQRSTNEIIVDYHNSQDQCRYLQRLTDQLVADQRLLLNTWKKDFLSIFTGTGQIIKVEEAVSEIITSTIRYFEYSIKNRLARPAGLNQSKPLPYKSESWRSGESINNLLAGVNMFEALLNVESGLAELLSQQGHADLAGLLLKRTRKLKSSLMAVETHLFLAVEQFPKRIQTVIHDYRSLTETLKTDVTRSLGIQIGFNDDDGD